MFINSVFLHQGFDASQGLEEGWLPTLLLLRDYDIPALFTTLKSVCHLTHV